MKPAAALVIAAGVLVLGSLFLWFRPGTTPETDLHPGEQIQTFEFTVANGRRVAGPEVIRVNQGETVEIALTTDRDDELHIHGYELVLPVTAGQPESLNFLADRSGRFEIELHRSHLDLTVIEVRPK